MHMEYALRNIYAYNMRIRSTPKRIFRMSQDFHHWWNYFFLTEGVFEEVRTAILFFQSVIFFYIFGMRWIEWCIWLLTNRSWRYLQIWCFRRGSHCEIFQSVCNARNRLCLFGHDLTGYALKCTLYPNICNKTPENYTQIYAVRKLVPKCAYLSRTEIRLTRVTIVC
jgi:hypothetical protein